MAEPFTKRRKTATDAEAFTITDPRFANIQSDPRFRLPGRRQKVKLDKRFSRALRDDDFSRKAKVDRYGRPLETDAEQKRLKRKYEFEEDEESDEVDDDDEVQQELQRVSKTHDPLREGKDGETSSSESSSDEDSDYEEEAEVTAEEAPDVPMGEVSSRLAVVNLDWDNIRAEDLMAVFSSEAFLGSSGRLLSVQIYPSEFGKERMQQEETEGPPREIFASTQVRGDDVSDSEEEDDNQIKDSLLKPDDGAEFDSQALRQYQLDRLRYFYAILCFSSSSAAKQLYDAVDGTEYLSTANFFDLRFVPDDTDFSTDEPREECNSIPANYKPNDFVTDALQHSKVKLTWDAEDSNRKDAVARAFRGGRKEIEENDLKAYLGSDSSDSDDEVEDEGTRSGHSKKELERQKMRALLGLAAEPEKRSKMDKAPVGGVQITFSAGLSGSAEGSKKKSVFENSPEPEETTVEKYVRREKERKQKRKERMKAAREGRDMSVDETEAVSPEAGAVEPGKETENRSDLGFDDPFFAEPHNDKAANTKMRKGERLKKRREREAEEAAEQKQRAELELLMADDGDRHGGEAPRHFDMKEIEKREKEARKKQKKKDKQKQKNKDEAVEQEQVQGADGFKLDTADPRFAKLFENHEYAIDPTNPKYRGTQGMQQLMEEGRKRRNKSGKEFQQDKEKGGSKIGAEARGSAGESEVLALVEKIKKRKG